MSVQYLLLLGVDLGSYSSLRPWLGEGDGFVAQREPFNEEKQNHIKADAEP